MTTAPHRAHDTTPGRVWCVAVEWSEKIPMPPHDVVEHVLRPRKPPEGRMCRLITTTNFTGSRPIPRSRTSLRVTAGQGGTAEVAVIHSGWCSKSGDTPHVNPYNSLL
jgi:hypothetical protein